MSTEPAPWGVAETVRLTSSGQVSAVEAVERCLETIARRNQSVAAFTAVFPDQALARARQLDEAREGDRPLGPLHGVPIGIKDQFDLAGTVTTHGGRGNSTPAVADAVVVRRLQAAGAVVVGKTAMSEMGTFPFTESVTFGTTRNPWDTDHTPGGSSGGSAAAVATGMVPAALGTDCGGSVRIPAACCGVVGFKPQRGRVSFAPRRHLWYGLGHIGPITRSVRDAALVLQVIRGSLPGDLHHAGEVGSFVEAADLEPQHLRIGWAKRPVTRGSRLHRTHLQALEDTIQALQDLGHEVVQRWSQSIASRRWRSSPSSWAACAPRSPRWSIRTGWRS